MSEAALFTALTVVLLLVLGTVAAIGVLGVRWMRRRTDDRGGRRSSPSNEEPRPAAVRGDLPTLQAPDRHDHHHLPPPPPGRTPPPAADRDRAPHGPDVAVETPGLDPPVFDRYDPDDGRVDSGPQARPASAGLPEPVGRSAPEPIEISPTSARPFRIRGDARLLCSQDGPTWLISQIDGRASCRLGRSPIDRVVLPVTRLASALAVSSRNGDEVLDLSEFARPQTSDHLRLHLRPLDGSDGAGIYGDASGAAVTIAIALHERAWQVPEDHVAPIVASIGDHWLPGNDALHAARALDLLLHRSDREHWAFAVIGLHQGRITIASNAAFQPVGHEVQQLDEEGSLHVSSFVLEGSSFAIRAGETVLGHIAADSHPPSPAPDR